MLAVLRVQKHTRGKPALWRGARLKAVRSLRARSIRTTGPLNTRAQQQWKQLRAHRFNRVSYLLRKSWYVMIVSFISQHTPDLLASSLACLRRLGISSASTAVIGPPRMHTIPSTPECSCDSMLIVRLTATQYLPCDW